MNVLTLVMTMLMMLAIVTYARLSTFLDFKGLQYEYHHYLTSYSKPLNDIQNEFYETELKGENAATNSGTNVQTGDDVAKTSSKNVNLNSLIPFDAFIKRDERERDSLRFKQTRELLKKLMENLYAEFPFFKALLEKRPELFNQLIDRIIEMSDQEIYIGKFKTKKDLGSLNLEDNELQEVLYKMLNGTREKTGTDVDEFLKKEGYPSLAKFIVIKKDAKLSIYLASGEILLALYGHAGLVKEIIATREDIYKQMSSDANQPEKDQGKDRLRSVAAGRSFLPNEDLLLDFSVSCTNPKKHR